MTDSGKLLRNVSVATALCATTALLAACGSARAGSAVDAAVVATGGAHTITQKPLDPKAWLIPKNVASIRVIAQPGAKPGPNWKLPPKRQIATVFSPAKVKLLADQMNTLPVGLALPCPSGDGTYLELDFYSAGHPTSSVAVAKLNNMDCNGVILSSGRQTWIHQGTLFGQVLKELGLTFPTR
ncbi:hypothetical protein EDD99_4758 [Streptomyces sp. 846.5]|nr:hypothetical protein [Streptomyces sp. 846.5]TDU06211.1 hypothetical protein EDD99_4758 [Streptomyces sp. 846.5]